MSQGVKFILQLLCFCIYPFSFLVPRKKTKWVFGSFRGAFNDNAKYVFIETQTAHPEIDSAWISFNKKTVAEIREHSLKAYHLFSVRGVWHALRSKYWFYNAYTSDILYCLSGNATTVNLWHGIPIKSIEFDITSGPLADMYVERTLRRRFYYPQVFKRPDYVLSPGAFLADYFARAFRVGREQCIVSGYPRNKILTCTEDERKSFIDTYEPQQTQQMVDEMKQYEKTFIYMPTWRNSQKDIFSTNMPLERIDAIMREQDSLFLVKPHANTKIDNALFANLTNVRLIDAKTDVYPILSYTDVLVSDYSSIMYDYMLMEGKGIVLYLYDYDEYTTNDRPFIFPFFDNTPGVKVRTFDELCDCLSGEVAFDNETERASLISKFWGDAAWTSNVIEKILEMR